MQTTRTTTITTTHVHVNSFVLILLLILCSSPYCSCFGSKLCPLINTNMSSSSSSSTSKSSLPSSSLDAKSNKRDHNNDDDDDNNNNNNNNGPTKTTVASASSSSVTAAGRAAIDFLTMARGLKTTLRTGWVRQEANPKIESVADHSWRIALMTMVAANHYNLYPEKDDDDDDDGTNKNDQTNNYGNDDNKKKKNDAAVASSSSSSSLDVNKCIKMALVHDLAEAKVGDITPHCGVSDQDKHSLELQAINEMTNGLVSLSTTLPSTIGGTGSSSTNEAKPTVLVDSTNQVGKEIFDLWKEYEEGTSKEAKLVKDMDKLEMILQALEYETDGRNNKSLDGFFDSTRDRWRTTIGRVWGAEIESRRKGNKKRQQGGGQNNTNDDDDDDGDDDKMDDSNNGTKRQKKN